MNSFSLSHTPLNIITRLQTRRFFILMGLSDLTKNHVSFHFDESICLTKKAQVTDNR